MTRIAYMVLRKNYPDKKSVAAEELYQWIGYPEYATNSNWQNTCAIRMSMGLIRSGIHISPGHMTVKAGECKGKRIEQNQRRLSDAITRTIGKPEIFEGSRIAKEKIAQRRGIISFFHLWGATDPQGHIDLVAPDEWGRLICEEDCYWSSTEVWFWALL